MSFDIKEFRGKQGKITESMKIKMKELREEGKTFKEIAETFNVVSSTVQYHLSSRRRDYKRKRYNSDPEYRERVLGYIKKYEAKKRGSPPTKTGRRWTPEEDELLVELRGRGLSYRKVAEYFTERTQAALVNRFYILRKIRETK